MLLAFDRLYTPTIRNVGLTLQSIKKKVSSNNATTAIAAIIAKSCRALITIDPCIGCDGTFNSTLQEFNVLKKKNDDLRIFLNY